jgi:hypothetical protein
MMRPDVGLGMGVLALLVCVGVACGAGSSSPKSVSSPSEKPVNYGPLALAEPSDTRVGTGAGTGPIEITEEFVTVDTLDGLTHLIWYANEVRWDEQDRTIIYRSINPAATPISFREGDIVDLGGAEPWDGLRYGTLHVTDQCINLQAPDGASYLLVFQIDDVIWFDGEVILRDVDSPPGSPFSRLLIGNSDAIQIDGYAHEPAEWHTPPHESCQGQPWLVESVDEGWPHPSPTP